MNTSTGVRTSPTLNLGLISTDDRTFTLLRSSGRTLDICAALS